MGKCRCVTRPTIVAQTPSGQAKRGHVAISINMAWNIANFRTNLIRALVSEGYEITAMAPPDDSIDDIERLGCRFVPLSMDNQGTNPMRDLLLLRRYVKFLREEQPDAMLLYTVKPNIYGSLAASYVGIPVLNNISGLGSPFIKRSFVTHIIERLYRLALARSCRVFFQNFDDRDHFVRNRLVRETQTMVLPGSGIDLNFFRPGPASIAGANAHQSKSADFLFIGRLLNDKGIREYVEAARLVKQKNPEATFKILGFLDVQNPTAVQRAEVDLWVAEGVVEYLGSTNDVRPYIANSDCIVLPSYREGTSRTLLEAAAMGKPLIATDVTGCREVVDDNINGLLCQVRDADDLAEKMIRLVNMTLGERQVMGQAGRRKMEEKYDESVVIDAYVNALQKSIGTDHEKAKNASLRRCATQKKT